MSGDLYERLLAAMDELYPDEVIVPTPRALATHTRRTRPKPPPEYQTTCNTPSWSPRDRHWVGVL